MAEPNDGRSMIYIYRPDVFSNSLISPGLTLDGKELMLIENGGYSYFYTKPGKHTLNLKLSGDYNKADDLIITTRPNRKHFVKLITYNKSTGYFAGNIGFKRTFNLIHVKEAAAETEIAECGYINPVKSEKFEKSYLVDN